MGKQRGEITGENPGNDNKSMSFEVLSWISGFRIERTYYTCLILDVVNLPTNLLPTILTDCPPRRKLFLHRMKPPTYNDETM